MIPPSIARHWLVMHSLTQQYWSIQAWKSMFY